ncbi:MAG: MFS transporter, partial [Chloroflexi bacterium]|nr:MFS transporter [Chloroflexota bacterium]
MNQFRFLAAVAVGLFVTMSASLMLAPLLVAIAAEFDTSVAVAGQLATATFSAWAVSVVSVGPLSDSFGRRPVALIGLSLLSIGVLASAFAPNLGILMALRVVTGLGGGM